MMKIESATSYLNDIPRITLEDIDKYFDYDVLLGEKDGQYEYLDNDKIRYVKDESTTNMKDLLRMVRIVDPFTCSYEETHVLMPRVYAQKVLTETPPHMNVQSIMFHVLDEQTLKFIKKEAREVKYDKTDYDRVWIGKNVSIDDLKVGDIIYLMNRRVGGWDGSVDRPVIELLTAGGHLPNVWNENKHCFETLDQKELIIREIEEELKVDLKDEKLTRIGGFHNQHSNALVVLYSTMLDPQEFMNAWNNSKNNIDENTDGMYAGEFNDVMVLYKENPEYFAGGEKAFKTNFPSKDEIMHKIDEVLNHGRTIK